MNSYPDTSLKGQLVGKQIREVFIAIQHSYGEEDNAFRDLIKFVPYVGDSVVYVAFGDCCSITWISDVLGISSLIGGHVRDVRGDDSEQITEEDYDTIAHYSYQILTDKGECSLLYKNMSNGYYGGSLDFMDEEPKDVEWRSLTGDYSDNREHLA